MGRGWGWKGSGEWGWDLRGEEMSWSVFSSSGTRRGDEVGGQGTCCTYCTHTLTHATHARTHVPKGVSSTTFPRGNSLGSFRIPELFNLGIYSSHGTGDFFLSLILCSVFIFFRFLFFFLRLGLWR